MSFIPPSLICTLEFLFFGPILPVSNNIRSFAGTSYLPIAKSNEGCPQKAPYVKNTFFILISIKVIQKQKIEIAELPN